MKKRVSEIVDAKNSGEEIRLVKILKEMGVLKPACVNVCSEGICRQVVVYSEPDFSDDKNHTIRAQVQDEADGLIVSFDLDVMLESPCVYYPYANVALVTFGYVQVVIQLMDNVLEAYVYEMTTKGAICPYGSDLKSGNKNIQLWDTQVLKG